MGDPIPKINPLHALPRRAQLKAQYRVLRPEVRRDTHMRDGRRCRICEKLLPLHGEPLVCAHIHERTGGSARKTEAIDLTLRSTITLCASCHTAVEHNKLHLECENEELAFNGPVLVFGRLPGGRQLKEPLRSLPTLTPQEARQP